MSYNTAERNEPKDIDERGETQKLPEWVKQYKQDRIYIYSFECTKGKINRKMQKKQIFF